MLSFARKATGSVMAAAALSAAYIHQQQKEGEAKLLQVNGGGWCGWGFGGGERACRKQIFLVVWGFSRRTTPRCRAPCPGRRTPTADNASA